MDDAVVASWARAEETLYAPLLADPPGYERVVRLVGSLAAYLRQTVGDIGGLIVASNRAIELVSEVMPEAALPWMPLEAAVQAACAIRYRELRVTMERNNRADLLRDAARSGTPWVRIVDPGSRVAARVAPALLVHMGSGLAIRCTTEMDPETGGARFVSTPVTVDLVTGDVVAGSSLGAGRSADSPDQRDADVLEWQRLMEVDSQRHVV
jgi:hypothetical protein